MIEICQKRNQKRIEKENQNLKISEKNENLLKTQIDYYVDLNQELQNQLNHCQQEYSNLKLNFDSKIRKCENDFQMKLEAKNNEIKIQKNKLMHSSICQVSTLPKETVRRKVRALVARKILTQNKSEGVLVGPGYKMIFEHAVPKTVAGFSKLLKKWKENGTLEQILKM
jgi:hypothetical protein